MVILSGSDIRKNPIQYKTAVALGSFDALHIGHIKIINKAAAYAKVNNLKSVVYMFKRSPKVVTGIDKSFINTVEKRIEILNNLDIDYVVVEEFTEEYRRISCRKFVNDYIGKFLNADYICAGFNYRFGYMGAGDSKTLTEMCREIGVNTYINECISFENVVSSSYIKTLIGNGDMKNCTKYLGREFSLKGTVIHGNEIGKTIGFPTANIEIPKNQIFPRFGVYITRAIIDNEPYPAITNIGTKPTVDESSVNIETNILGFSGEIYGKEIEVRFIKRLRDIVKFDGLNALKEQLDKDKSEAVEYFRANN